MKESMSVLEVQQALSALGYDPGEHDDVWGPDSRAACKAFQSDQGLGADGIPGPNTQVSLKAAVKAKGVRKTYS